MQYTVAKTTTFNGIGLHSGRIVNMRFSPAPANTGIVFIRADLTDRPHIHVSARHVTDTRLCTVITEDEVSVSTVEHLMCALALCGIDNLHIDIDGDEVPILDGSAIPFVYLLGEAGRRAQASAKRVLKVERPVEVTMKGKVARLSPCDRFVAELHIDFRHPVIANSKQSLKLDQHQHNFIHELARARTFGFMDDIDHLRAMGLCRGGSIDNAVVLNDSAVINVDGLRYEDEFVRHKMLDVIGDLYVEGLMIKGYFYAECTGHGLNNLLMRELLSSEANYSIQLLDSKKPSIDGYAEFPLALSF